MLVYSTGAKRPFILQTRSFHPTTIKSQPVLQDHTCTHAIDHSLTADKKVGASRAAEGLNREDLVVEVAGAET